MELVGPPQGWVECGWGVMRGEAGLSQNQITQDPQSRLRGLDFILKPWGALFRVFPSKSGAARFLFEKYSSLDMEWEAGGMEAGRQVSVGSGVGGVGDEWLWR